MTYCCALRLWSQICITCRDKWFSLVKPHRAHRCGLTRENIVDNTIVLCRQNDIFRLLIHEAILINFKNPTLNRQDIFKTICWKLPCWTRSLIDYLVYRWLYFREVLFCNLVMWIVGYFRIFVVDFNIINCCKILSRSADTDYLDLSRLWNLFLWA